MKFVLTNTQGIKAPSMPEKVEVKLADLVISLKISFTIEAVISATSIDLYLDNILPNSK